MAQTGNPRTAGRTLRKFFPVGGGKTSSGEIYTNLIGDGILMRANDDNGSTITLYDPALRSYGSDFFNGMRVVNITGIAYGETNIISDFDEDTGLVTFAHVWSAAVAKNDFFKIELPGTINDGGYVQGTLDTSPLGTTLDLWSTSGPIIIRDLFGIVTTTAIQAQATNVKITFDPDDGGANTDLCANVDATGIVTGSIIRLTGDITDAAIISTDVAEASGYDMNKGGIILSQAGDILVTYGATSNGQINWFIKYDSLGGIIIVGA